MPNPTAPAPENNKPKQSAYLVCDGALCQCSAGAAPVKLKVTSHKKAYINADKLVATEKDVTFDQPGHFGTCSFKPLNSNACVPAVQQWMKPYKDIEVENQKVITDKSELLCSVGGKIIIKMHGQQQSVNAGQAENMDRAIAAQVNPLANLAPIAEADKKVSVSSITGELVDDPKYKAVTTQPNQSTISITDKEIKANKKIEDPADIYVRPGQEIKFTAKYDGTESLVCWKISSTKDPVYFLQHGPTYKSSFEELGKYTIEGYGTGRDSNLDVDTQINKENKRVVRGTYTECMLDILVQKNKLTGIHHLESKNIIKGKVDNKAGVHLRIGVPVTFEPVYLMPPIQEEIDHLILVIKDASGNEVQRSKGAPNIVFAAQNSAANYNVEAYFDNSEAAPFTYPFRTAHNTVSVIAASGMQAENEKIRPGKELTFSVKEYKFSEETVEEELLAIEHEKMKWYENSLTPVATGTTYTKTYHREGEYVVKCAVTQAQKTWFSKEVNFSDDWRFKVTKNYPTAIEQKTEGKAKVGKRITFELKGIFAIDYSDAATITWQLTGPESIATTRSYAFVFTPRNKGSYTLTATMHGKTVNFPFECIACEIIKGWWTDGDGNMLTGSDSTSDPSNTIGFAGWAQEVVATFKHVGLNGEDVTLEVWDKDTTSNTSVFKKDIKVSDSYTVDTCSIKLDQQLRDKVIEKGITADGLLYFTIKAKNGLKVINDGMVLPENYLKVDSTVRIKMYFADNNDKQRYSTAALDTPVFVKVKSTNLIGEELEMELWKAATLAYNAAVIGKRVTFKVDKCGMASIKLNIDAIKPELPKTNDLIYINVKFFIKKTGEELYLRGGNNNLTLYKTLATSASSIGTTKAFVVVDTSQGGNNKVCECKKYDLIWGNKVSCAFRKKIVEISINLGLPQKDYEGANWLMAVMALETVKTFNPAITNNQGYTGLIQIGKDAATSLGTSTDKLKEMDAITQLDYVEKYFKQYKNKLTTLTDIYLSVLYPSASGHGNENDYIVFDDNSTGIKKKAYLQNPTFHQEEDEITKNSAGKIIARNGKIDGKTYIWEVALSIKAFETAGLGNKYDYSKCNNLVVLNAKDVITYRIYSDGKIEKHIPSIIKENYKNKYKYVYHDKNNKEHEITTCEFSIIDKRANGVEINEVPSDYESTYDYPVGGNAQTAYVYKNNDIIVTGTEYGIRKYPKGVGKIELIRMPDNLSYLIGNVKVYYNFKNSQRRYCNPDAFAAFIGALAEIDRTDVECTGMCFSDSTSYPSLSHPNGDSVDTVYFKTLEEEQKKVNSFLKFNFTHIYRGNASWYGKLKGTSYSKGHEDHLHSGEFNTSKIKIVSK